MAVYRCESCGAPLSSLNGVVVSVCEYCGNENRISDIATEFIQQEPTHVAELCIRCYEDNVAGKLSDEMFMRFSQKYETERLELKEKISAYRKRLSEVDEMRLGKEKFIAAVREFMQMDKLTAPLLQELIDRIDVYEVTGTGKNRKQMIKIHYKFVGYLELPSLARQHNYREETRKGVAVEYVPNALPA